MYPRYGGIIHFDTQIPLKFAKKQQYEKISTDYLRTVEAFLFMHIASGEIVLGYPTNFSITASAHEDIQQEIRYYVQGEYPAKYSDLTSTNSYTPYGFELIGEL